MKNPSDVDYSVGLTVTPVRLHPRFVILGQKLD